MKIMPATHYESLTYDRKSYAVNILGLAVVGYVYEFTQTPEHVANLFDEIKSVAAQFVQVRIYLVLGCEN